MVANGSADRRSSLAASAKVAHCRSSRCCGCAAALPPSFPPSLPTPAHHLSGPHVLPCAGRRHRHGTPPPRATVGRIGSESGTPIGRRGRRRTRRSVTGPRAPTSGGPSQKPAPAPVLRAKAPSEPCIDRRRRPPRRPGCTDERAAAGPLFRVSSESSESLSLSESLARSAGVGESRAEVVGQVIEDPDK